MVVYLECLSARGQAVLSVASLVALLVSERVVNSDILLAFLLEFSMAVCSVALLDRNVVECLDAEMAA